MTHEQFLAHKEHDKFTQIYLPFSGKMYALAYNLLRNRDEARDCVQDAYAELWNKRDTIEPEKQASIKTDICPAGNSPSVLYKSSNM